MANAGIDFLMRHIDDNFLDAGLDGYAEGPALLESNWDVSLITSQTYIQANARSDMRCGQ